MRQSTSQKERKPIDEKKLKKRETSALCGPCLDLNSNKTTVFKKKIFEIVFEHLSGYFILRNC